MNQRERQQLSALETFRTTQLFASRRQTHLQAILQNFHIFFILSNSGYTTQLLNSMFEGFEKMLQTENPLLLPTHPCFGKLVLYFIFYNTCKKRIQLNLGQIIIPGYQGSSLIKNIISDRVDDIINLEPELGT